MNKLFVAALSTASLISPASAITFPTLTTIYIIPGVRDTGMPVNTGIATSVICTNVSGVTAAMRFLALQSNGDVVADDTFNMDHGDTQVVSTHGTLLYSEIGLSTGAIQGSINVESTQSGVFCTAVTLEADGFPEFSFSLHPIRVNPHPGTVE